MVVVDNASSDGSADALRRRRPPVRRRATGANLGYGAGANRGVGVTAAPISCWCPTPTSSCTPGRWHRSRPVLDGPTPPGHRRPADPRRRRHPLPLGPPLPLAGRRGRPRRARCPRPRQPLHPLVPHGRPRPGASGPPTVDWVSGACFLARRRAFDELGGFDESYFMYAEDVDLCWRARRAGWGVAYVPGAVGHPSAGRLDGPPTPTACSSPITARCSASPAATGRVAPGAAPRWRWAWPCEPAVAGQAGAAHRWHRAPGSTPGRRRVSPDHGRGDRQEDGWRAPAPRAGAELPRAEAHQVVRQPGHDLPGRRGRSSSTAATSDPAPAVGRAADHPPHWYAALGFDVCGTVQPNLPANPNTSQTGRSAPTVTA